MKDQDMYTSWVEKFGGFAKDMTLRDYFAANALAVVPAQAAHNMEDNERLEPYLARRAYAIADAMLKARGQQC